MFSLVSPQIRQSDANMLLLFSIYKFVFIYISTSTKQNCIENEKKKKKKIFVPNQFQL